LQYNAKFRALAADMGVPAATLAIAWILHQGPHLMAIPGTRHIAHLKEAAQGGALDLSPQDIAAIETVLPIGWAHGDRYSVAQWIGPERYC
jgi:aryl-alcohol dehydrogenase-like predicted oxidoreductase